MNIIAARNICEDEVNTDKNIRVCVMYTESQLYTILGTRYYFYFTLYILQYTEREVSRTLSNYSLSVLHSLSKDIDI